MKRHTVKILSGFWLKLIAMLSMTIDHVGIFLCYMAQNTNLGENAMFTTGYMFRVVGRLAMPLFILLLVDGIRKTSNHIKYLARIGITMAVIMVFEAITFTYFNTAISYAQSPFVDLFLIAITLYLINRKDKYSYLSILPIGYVLLVTAVQIYEMIPINGITHNILWLPFYIRPAYSLFGLALGLAFYFSYYIVDRNLKAKGGFDDAKIEMIKDTDEYRVMVSGYIVAALIIVNVITFALGYLVIYDNHRILDLYNFALQGYSVLASIFILLYNGKRGYNKKWFKYGCYIYFPVHLILIFIIFFVIL